MQHGENDAFRKLVSNMLVAARRNKKALDITVITARLKEALARGEGGDPEALKAHVLAGLKDAPRVEREKPVKRRNRLGAS